MSKRLFFTKFGWESDSPVEIERNIKLFSLINTDLVIPSNHIYSKAAEQLFRKYPELLEKGIIRPALGSKYSKYEDYLITREHKAGRNLIEYGRYLDSLNSNPEKYPSDSPALIFTNHAIDQINNSESVLSKASSITKVEANKLNVEITDCQNNNEGVVYFRDFLDLSRRILNNNSYKVFEKYAYLLRYTSGASSKNCNNLLPQENLINWCLANPNNPEEFVLQDEQLFWEVFIESMVKVTEGIFSLKDLEKLSPNLLDRLSFNDIHNLRNEGVLRNNFINKYNSIIDKINVIRTSKDNRLDLVDYETLISLKESLKEEFEEALIQESSVYKEIELLEALAKVAYQIWGGTFQTIESVINFFSILFDRKRNIQKLFEQQEKRISKAKKFATKKLGDEAVLIEYMDRLVLKTKEAWYK
jgi:hypothetical protein